MKAADRAGGVTRRMVGSETLTLKGRSRGAVTRRLVGSETLLLEGHPMTASCVCRGHCTLHSAPPPADIVTHT